jgi:hypothetical protein
MDIWGPDDKRARSESTVSASQEQEILRKYYGCADEFKNRKRYSMWLYISGSLVLFVGLSLFVHVLGKLPFSFGYDASTIGIAVFAGWYSWFIAAPFCPNCKQNVRHCSAVHCHVCGQPLSAHRCERCGVHQSVAAVFDFIGQNSGNRQRITFCPGCGIFLDTPLRRWFGNGDGG